MRSLEQLQISPEEARLRERAKEVVNAPEAVEAIEVLVSKLETWAQVVLFSERDDDERPKAPALSTSAFGLPSTEGKVAARCTHLVLARALARTLLSGLPSTLALERLADVLHYARWDEFDAAIAAMVGDPRASAWINAAKFPDYEQYLAGALECERDAVRQASERWRGNPRVFGQLPDWRHIPLGSAFATALPILQRLDPKAWFEALRQAPLRAEVELAIRGVAGRPDELLRMLAQAPAAVDSDGNETGHVAAILLAEKAWRYPVEIERTLDSRVRVGGEAARKAVEDDRSAFVDHEVDPWLERVWTVLCARPDGKELSLALAVRQIAARTRNAPEQPTEVARKVAEELENRVSAAFRPRLEELPALLDDGDLGRHNGPLERWCAFARIACDDVGDVEVGARAAWDRLVKVLSQGDGSDSLRWPEHVSDETWDFAGWVLARQSRPAEDFTRVFDDLLLERERARMGARDGSDLPVTPVRSRVVVCVGAHTLVQPPVADAPASFLPVVFAALREMWLGLGGDDENLWLVRQTYLYGAVAYRRRPSGAPAANVLYEALVDALRDLAPDPCLSCEVAALWLDASWSAEAVVGAFQRAGIDVRRVCANLLAEPDAWRRGDLKLESLAQALGANDPGAGA